MSSGVWGVRVLDAEGHCFGGLADHAFRLVPLLEQGCDADWPWMTKVA
jgi:hypothetical protein